MIAAAVGLLMSFPLGETVGSQSTAQSEDKHPRCGYWESVPNTARNYLYHYVWCAPQDAIHDEESAEDEAVLYKCGHFEYSLAKPPLAASGSVAAQGGERVISSMTH